MARFAISGPDIFDGVRTRRNAALIVKDGMVEGIAESVDLDPDLPVERLDGGTLAPGFVDIQVNGGGGVLLNDRPDVEGVRAICEAHLGFGTTSLLPTVITDREEVTFAAIEGVRTALARHVPGCGGIHVEGPFIALKRKGAHDPACVRVMTDEDVAKLCAVDVRPFLITVATESVTPEQIATLSRAGIHVSIGHCDGSYDDVMAAISAGASCVTHLFNAMSQLGHRTPGVAGAALDSPDVWASIIADGHHVHPAMVELALRAKKGENRMIAISDAMPTVGSEGQVFELGGRRATRNGGKLTLDDGTLAGCDISMLDAVTYLVRTIGLSLEEALRMATANPSRLLRREADRGFLKAGSPADLVWLRDDLSLGRLWLHGRERRNEKTARLAPAHR
ncbi:N-acetylglucosamine-6-phosphate deacetylase [Aureimonas sp. AU40]|uniref:N-acetylglucosamine-6-phosphate deacetylase n=1 Tax=Aureimonas sp. AU40 TaxID=1637747 RepID=UPI0007842F66|nr:N-acetylglucosamine-6-phosphate deacetylase [Aureimonas sp. AU40]